MSSNNLLPHDEPDAGRHVNVGNDDLQLDAEAREE